MKAELSSLSSIFHTYDIRGVYGQELTDDLSELIGKATGTFYRRSGVEEVVVGRDNRPSGVQLTKRFIVGLRSTGCNVVDLGVVTTPMVYSSWYLLKADAAASITASHNPAPYNGIKLTFKKQGLFGKQYQIIKNIILRNDFEEGSGSVDTLDIFPLYQKELIKDLKIAKKLKIVIDCGNGTTSLFAPKILNSIGVEVVELFTRSDGTFPNHDPYPQKTELYKTLAQTIRRTKADFGIAYDGDGDRMGIYDENGQFVQNDIIGALFARQILEKHKGANIVFNISASMAVLEAIKDSGGNPILWKTGYPFIVSKMKETGAYFGAEISGHFFFKDRYFGYDDGLYASLRFIELMSRSSQSVSQIVQSLPRYFASPEFRVEVPKDEDKKKIVDEIAQEVVKDFPEAEILSFDGIRFTLPNKSWGLIRPSNTEPMLSGRAEAKNKEDLRKIQDYISQKLAKFGIELKW